jgi:signal transduction histidine kinase
VRLGGTRALATAVAVVTWTATVAGLASILVSHAHVVDLGRRDLAADPTESLVYGSAMLSAATVGLVVASRRQRHPVGWLFLALGIALAIGGAGDAYAFEHAVVGGDDGALPRLALVAGQASFIAWFGLLAGILHLTPTGTPLSPRWAIALRVTAVASIGALLAKAVQDTPFDPPFERVRNPWAVESLAAVVDAVAALGILLTMLGLLVAGASLIVRFRRAVDEERRQLAWMAALIVPLPVLIPVAYVAAVLDVELVRTIATGGFVALLPIAAGLSVLRFRLYDVDRILSRATAYALSSLVLAIVYGSVAAAVGRTLGLFVDDATPPAVAAAVVTVMAAAPLHRRLQDVIDRRFDRRRYEAHRLVRQHLGSVRPARSLEKTLAAALHDPALEIAYFLPAQERWATADGRPATLAEGDLEVRRNGAPVARLRLQPGTDARLAASLASEALAELDNIRLRAEVAAQLEEVRASRARIVEAQAEERHRIERNLHDGAQQRLLGLAMHLRAEQLRRGPEGTAAIEQAVTEVTTALRELRDLANGLRPAALTEGGLTLALDGLAGRFAIPVELDVEPTRLPPVVEETLWFVACEAMVNVAKHASASRAWITVTVADGHVTLQCRDDGAGGADTGNRGLRGIADRTEAAGGHLHVVSEPGRGTTIEAVVPCAS